MSGTTGNGKPAALAGQSACVQTNAPDPANRAAKSACRTNVAGWRRRRNPRPERTRVHRALGWEGEDEKEVVDVGIGWAGDEEISDLP